MGNTEVKRVVNEIKGEQQLEQVRFIQTPWHVCKDVVHMILRDKRKYYKIVVQSGLIRKELTIEINN